MRTTEPISITQGEQIEWSKSFADYPADEWTLSYRFRGPATGFNVNATADGLDFTITLTATNSLTMDAGKWKWQAWATNIADTAIKLMILNGELLAEQGFASDETGDIETRSPNKILLDAIDAALQSRATADQLEFEVSTPAGSTRIKRAPIVDLIAARKMYAAIVARENTQARLRNGGKFGVAVKARFTET
jgi:hypothetical protein